MEIASTKVNTFFAKPCSYTQCDQPITCLGALFRKLSALIHISGTDLRAFLFDPHASAFQTDPQMIHVDPQMIRISGLPLSSVLLYLESHARYRKSRKLEKPFFGLQVSNCQYFRRLMEGLKIFQHIIFKTYV